MKILLTLFVLLFSSLVVVAEDISDFQIEGISVGDSLLNYMSEEKILIAIQKNKNRYTFLEDINRFVEVYKNDSLKTYDYIKFFVKPDDEKFLIYLITGAIEFTNDFSGCKKKQKEIVKEISKMFIGTKKDEGTYKHRADPTNRSILYYVRFTFQSGDNILIQCMDFEENFRIKKNWREDLQFTITTAEVQNWFRPL